MTTQCYISKILLRVYTVKQNLAGNKKKIILQRSSSNRITHSVKRLQKSPKIRKFVIRKFRYIILSSKIVRYSLLMFNKNVKIELWFQIQTVKRPIFHIRIELGHGRLRYFNIALHDSRVFIQTRMDLCRHR